MLFILQLAKQQVSFVTTELLQQKNISHYISVLSHNHHHSSSFCVVSFLDCEEFDNLKKEYSEEGQPFYSGLVILWDHVIVM